MNSGDLLGSGTISGEDKYSVGSLLELSNNGKEPFKLSNGEERSFLHDNDIVIMKGFAEKDGVRVGFGECVGKIMPSLPESLFF